MNAITYGAKLMLPGLLRYESNVEQHEECVLITTKGEAIAIGIAMMSAVEMTSCDHGVVAKVKRCIMERDLYPRRWGLGPQAAEKKKLKADGKLDKYGRANAETPAKWTDSYTDYSAPQGADASKPTEASSSDLPKAVAPAAIVPDDASKESKDGESKKRKKHEGETADEKAERKRRKAEKKAKKASKDEDDSD